LRVCVIGGCGFIGSHTVKHLTDSGCKVLVLDSFTQYCKVPTITSQHHYNVNYRHQHLLNQSTVMRCSTLNKNDLRRKLYGFKPHVILTFASLPIVSIAKDQTEEAFHNIVSGTVNILEVLRDMKCHCRVVFVSSSMVYGNFCYDPQPEDSPAYPRNVYGGMKLATENIIRSFHWQYGIPFTIIRPSCVYGPTDNNHRIVQNFLEAAISKTSAQVDDVTKTMDFSYVKDVAVGISAACTNKKADGQTFNITYGKARRIQELITIIRNHFSDFAVTKNASDPIAPRRWALDISNAVGRLNYNPRYDLEMGIAEYAMFLKKAMRGGSA